MRIKKTEQTGMKEIMNQYEKQNQRSAIENGGWR